MQQNNGDLRSMRARRRQLGMTLRDLAQQCADEGAPISHSQLSKIERGLIEQPRPRTSATLSRILARADESRRTPAPAAAVDMQPVRDGERAEPVDVPELRRSVS